MENKKSQNQLDFGFFVVLNTGINPIYFFVLKKNIHWRIL